MSDLKLQATNTLNQLSAQAGNVIRALDNADIDTLRAVHDELLAFTQLQLKVDTMLTDKLQEAFATLEPGEKLKFGLYEYEKVQKKSASKLDENKLKEIIQDQDLLDSCFEIVKKPLTQVKLAKVFAENKLDIDVKQLYIAELKNEFEIKPKN